MDMSSKGEVSLRATQSDQDEDGQLRTGEGGACRKSVRLTFVLHASGLLQPPLLQKKSTSR